MDTYANPLAPQTLTPETITRVTVLEPSPGTFLGLLLCLPVACLTSALLTDIAYVYTANMMWADFSDWLLAAGMAGGVLAALVGTVRLIANRRPRVRSPWPLVVGGLATLVVAFVNNLVHSRDAWTSVMPEGLALSAVTVLVMLATGWLAFATPARGSLTTTYAGARP